MVEYTPGGGMGTTTEVIVALKLLSKQFEEGMKNVIKKTDVQFTRLNKTQKKVNQEANSWIQIQRKMVMSMLGVMFFGMMLTRTFMGLLTPAADVFGIFELWSTTLMVLFIPIMEILMPLFVEMITMLMEMPDGLKMALGLFVLLGLIFGVILTTIGQLGLGLSSFMAFITGKEFPLLLKNLKGIMEYGDVVIGITLALYGFKEIQDAIDKIQKGVTLKAKLSGVSDLFGGLATEALAIGLVTGDKAMKKQAGAFAVGSVILELITSNISGDAYNFFDSLKLALKGAFGAGLMGFGIQGAFVVFSALLLIDWAWKGGGDKFRNLIEDIQNKVSTIGRGLKQTIPAIDWQGPFTFKASKNERDFIWRPGQSPVSISPNDTLIGKESGGGFGNNITINQTINAKVNDMREFEYLIKDNNTRLVQDIRRLSTV